MLVTRFLLKAPAPDRVRLRRAGTGSPARRRPAVGRPSLARPPAGFAPGADL